MPLGSAATAVEFITRQIVSTHIERKVIVGAPVIRQDPNISSVD
jgi:hypothetical protein